MCLNLKLVLIWLALLLSTNTELRFCFKGPHKVQDTDCPGGILFKAPVELSCIDLRKVIGKTTRAVYSTNLCSPGITEYKANTNSLVIQMINISLENESTGGTASSSPIYEGCTPECLSTVEQSFHKNIIDSEPEFDDGIPAQTNASVLEQMDISEKLFTYIMSSNEYEPRRSPEPRILTLFQAMQKILLKNCGESYLTSAFMNRVYLALKWMAVKSNKFKIKDMGVHEFSVIGSRLHHCLNSSRKSLELSGTACASSKRLQRIDIYSSDRKLETLKYKIEAKSFRWGKYDTFMEAAWTVLDFVLNFCFDSFIPNLNHHHILQTHVESLFTPAVQIRWMYPTKLFKGDQYWNILANVRDIKWTMRNLDFCAQAASRVSPYQERLDRPFSNSASKTAPIVSTTVSMDESQAPLVVGWQDTEAKYWERYEAKGGFKGVLREFGYCAQTSAEAEKYKRKLRSKCSTA